MKVRADADIVSYLQKSESDTAPSMLWKNIGVWH